jgi:hypothetical protein
LRSSILGGVESMRTGKWLCCGQITLPSFQRYFLVKLSRGKFL